MQLSEDLPSSADPPPPLNKDGNTGSTYVCEVKSPVCDSVEKLRPIFAKFKCQLKQRDRVVIAIPRKKASTYHPCKTKLNGFGIQKGVGPFTTEDELTTHE
jgi:hypothetical protein